MPAPATIIRGLCAVALCLLAQSSFAQSYPARPVRVVVPWPAGIGPDTICRQVTQKLADRLGQPFVVDNKPGVAGHLGGETVVKAAPDGHTLLCGVSTSFVTTPHVLPKLAYNPLNDLEPISLVGRSQMVLVATPSLPVDDLPSLLAYMKANPGKLAYASQGIGSSNHLAMELLKIKAGVTATHVPYNAIGAAGDLVSGRVQLLFDPYVTSAQFIQTGKLKLVAVASGERLPDHPGVKTAQETIPGLELWGWAAFFAPVGTPRAIVEQLNVELRKVLDTKDIKDSFNRMGFVTAGMPSEEARRYIKSEYDRWGSVVRDANIKPEQ